MQGQYAPGLPKSSPNEAAGSMNLIFLKLGGSLITDKTSPHTPRLDILHRLVAEIHTALDAQPDLRLVIGHGSGSFGHVPAHRHHTREGVHTPSEWAGFIEVWREARALNQIVVESLAKAGLPVIAMPPSAAVTAAGGQVSNWDLSPLQSALAAGLIPLVNGDTIFDTRLGGTILSTEELFFYLARRLKPRRIALAGIETGVWADFPTRSRLIECITPDGLGQVADRLLGSSAVDVTGGMLSKVRTMLDLLADVPDLEILIFSGLVPGNVILALSGKEIGTRIRT